MKRGDKLRVKLPFMAGFRDALLTGRKSQTSRTTRRGHIGDRFEAFGSTFELIDVHQAELQDVAFQYLEEGLDSYEEFKRVWITLHPRKGFIPSCKVWVHVFKKL